jgi:hypothetical protein
MLENSFSGLFKKIISIVVDLCKFFENSYRVIKDLSRIRIGESSENMAALRTIALNLLKQGKTKSSLKQKRFRAAMDNAFLFRLLTQI